MPIQYKNGRSAKENDAVIGLDWRNCVVKGTAIKGDKTKGHPELVFQHGVFKTVCPSLALENFVLAEDAIINTDGIHSVTAKPVAVEPTASPAPATAEA